jgi:hypothetical protein
MENLLPKEAMLLFLKKHPKAITRLKGIYFFKPKGGLFFPFQKYKLSGFKLNAFYDVSINKYNFYNKDIFATRLNFFKGD